MKPRDIFGILFRTMAVYAFMWGMWNTLAGIRFIYPTMLALLNGTEFEDNSFTYFMYGLPAVFAAILALRFAESFISFTYRERPTPPPLG